MRACSHRLNPVTTETLTIEDHWQFEFLYEVFRLVLEAALIFDVELEVVADLLFLALIQLEEIIVHFFDHAFFVLLLLLSLADQSTKTRYLPSPFDFAHDVNFI